MSEKRILKINRKKDNNNNNNNKHKLMTYDKFKQKTRKLVIHNFGKFYDKFVEENGISPNEFIDSVNKKILLIYYQYKLTGLELTKNPNKKLKEMIMKNKKDIDKYIHIYMKESYVTLSNLNLWDPIQNHINKLYEVLHYLLNDCSIEIPLEFPLGDIYCRGRYFLMGGKQNTLNNPTFVKKDNLILETSNTEKIDRDNKEYEESKVFIEYANNRYLSIPILFYKRLSEIEYMYIEYTIFDIPYETSEEDDPYLEREPISTITRKCKSIKDMILMIKQIEGFQDSFISFEDHGIYYESMKFKIDVYFKDGTHKFYNNFTPFGDYYFGFIDK